MPKERLKQSVIANLEELPQWQVNLELAISRILYGGVLGIRQVNENQ